MARSRPQRAAVYVRVSTHDQDVENQLDELRRYVAARGWEAREYRDEGVSGALDQRPALDRVRLAWRGHRLHDTGWSLAASHSGRAGAVRARAHRRAGAGRARSGQARGPAPGPTSGPGLTGGGHIRAGAVRARGGPPTRRVAVDRASRPGPKPRVAGGVPETLIWPSRLSPRIAEILGLRVSRFGVVEKPVFFDHPGRAHSAKACRISRSQDADVRDVRPSDPPTGRAARQTLRQCVRTLSRGTAVPNGGPVDRLGVEWLSLGSN